MTDSGQLRVKIREQQRAVEILSFRQIAAELDTQWERILQQRDLANTARDAATTSTDLLMAELGALAAAKQEASASVRSLAIALMVDLGVPATTVANAIGVAGTTVSRWAGAAER